MVLVDNSLEGKEKPLGRHIVIQQPHIFRHHEVEDLDKLSSVVFTKSHDPSHWNTQLYKVSDCCQLVLSKIATMVTGFAVVYVLKFFDNFLPLKT